MLKNAGEVFKKSLIPDKKKYFINPLIFLTEITGVQALLRYAKYGTWDIFSMVFIETTTACNRRCRYCPNSKFDRGLMRNVKKMEPELFYKIIDELAALAPAGWAGDIQPHFYGEPLLDGRLPGFIRYIRSKLPASPISVFTNGDFLTVDLYIELVNSGVTRFAVTRHSIEESSNMRDVLEYRKKQQSGKVKLDYRRLETGSNKGGLIDIEAPIRPEKCAWPPSTVGIDYEGNVLFCCHDYFSTASLGNIKNERLIDVWRKPYYRRLRKDLRRGVFNLDLCKKCGEGAFRN
ncbi:MAG: hypothetical protein A2270_02765 [Elusimicrobia bacterium RIFOXYA12_FULL_51_18]|nr:MAG: hypothetical protein A2270_02765 [Elusimicrobia bacterium RIFOXYA12_FULL_51_18]OGS28330.1 MAG: hypothetical protein A2218_00055 [Elusimicrobia bacterium RIFOXYA2_FULL_53_38]